MKGIKLVLTIICLTSCLGDIWSQKGYSGKLGYGFSPKGHPYDYSLMGDFLQEVANTCNGGVVLANGSWRDSVASSGAIPKFQKDICSLQPLPYSYIDMVVFAWGAPTNPYTLYLDVPGDGNNKWSNLSAQKLFLKMLIHAADSLKPSYFFIGNEISFYYEQDSIDYLKWIDFYNQAYDSVKVHSPQSKVGTVFNYEHLSGSGKLIGWNKPYWGALDAMDTSKIDILGLTVYPFFNYESANSIPVDYLAPIFNKMSKKPVAITETGWPSDSLLANWYCSPQQQVNYVDRLFNLIDGQNVEVVNWLYLYHFLDKRTDENKLSASISMHDSIGNNQPALSKWLSYCNQVTAIDNIIDETKKSVFVYPNPFSKTTNIEANFEMNNAYLNIYDLNGKIVKHQRNLYGKVIQIDIGSLSQGVYFFQLNENEKIFTGKLIVI